MRLRLDRISDEWYESEESTRAGMIAEVQRIRRRLRARPLPVIVLGLALGALITYKIATRKPVVEAEIVLELTEGSMASKHHAMPFDDLRHTVDGALLTDQKLGQLIERRDLFPLRRKLGMEYALEQLHEQIDIQIWKNSFMYYDEDSENSEKSARIGITVSDTDGDRAYAIARDLAAIVIETDAELRDKANSDLANAIETTRNGLTKRLDALARQTAERNAALERARRERLGGEAQEIALELAELEAERKEAEKRLTDIAKSRDVGADRIAAAGLDTSIAIVEEHRPEHPEGRGFLIAMIAVIVGIGSLLGAALVVGAFDPRVHDTDDVIRLGLPVLGHVPGFAGDQIGSLRTRGASGRRVPSIARWRSQQ